MSKPNFLTDTKALARNRSRIKPEALFLHAAAQDDLQDRLDMVNRTFKTPAIVTGVPGAWGGFLPNARLVADNEVLDLAPATHDLIIHAMSLHWANDPVGQLIQCQRALVPDGLLICCLLGGQTLHELRSALSQAEVEITGGLSARIAPMGEIRDLGALLQRAGFALPVADSVPMTASYRNLAHLAQDLRGMGETNVLATRSRSMARKAVFKAADRLYAQHFPAEGNRITATFELVMLTGWSPDASQPKPLRPGSAKARLADALRVPETKLTD